MKKFLMLIIFTSVIISSGCDPFATDASRASQNISKAADQFEINRRIVFYNGITDKYILSVEGRCSVEFRTLKFEVTCKIGSGKNEFKKHYLGRADNVFPFIEQLDYAKADVYHYRVIFKPKAMLPNFELK